MTRKPMPLRRTAFALAAIGLAAVVLAGCGRRNDPITPYEAAVEARKEAERAGEKPLPAVPPKPNDNKRFILDGLID